ncbi:MAG: tetratricopeptide repeat protein [Desulfobulbaceae bacterium]|jgi:tetratricopeptide (TPR) repeat protein|nr:tetratricopeptide repeat protein [Desulfobulbaceae bacterium]
MSFPFYHDEVAIASRDLDLLAPLFESNIKESCPCEGVYFMGPSVSGDGLPVQWNAGVEVVRNGLKPVKDKGKNPALYLPLWTGEELFGVAVLIGAEVQVLELSAGLLLEKSKAVSRELHMLKLAAIEPITQLGNSLVLQSRVALATLEQDIDSSLVLFDLFPKASGAGKAGAAVAKVGACLHALIGHLAHPCHLGNGLFGLCWQGGSEETALKMADQVLQWLKRDNIGKGHVGIAVCDGSSVDQLLDQAWQALLIAQKRGPFGICSYTALSDRASHPLYPPPGKTLRQLRQLMKDDEQFSLIELKPDDPAVVFSAPFCADLPGVTVPTEHGGAYVFLAGASEKESLGWCRSAQTLFAENGVSFSMGVCVYPYENFRKGEIIGNCRKALLHTAFFGEGTWTVFDGVSLNISGDVYYNEGDMLKASREYQRGLDIDPENVNLLNSIGVTTAQMARYTKAVSCFEKVLTVDPRDFMALCNLGFAHLALNHPDEAIAYFEEALGGNDVHFDLLFQLGKLYVGKGRYRDAIRVLAQAEEIGPEHIEDVSHGAVHCLLGEAYYHEKNRKKATGSLQRAIRYNSRDSLSLSLLGELYGQDEPDIGLTFCQQAVEIDGECWRHWLRLGTIHLARGNRDEARRVLTRILRLQRQHEDVSLFQAKLSEAEGDAPKACGLYQQVLKLNAKNRDAAKAVKRLKRSIQETGK